jgi:hypothetical protein
MLVVVALSIPFNLAARALTASPTVTVIFVVLCALVGIFVLLAQQGTASRALRWLTTSRRS